MTECREGCGVCCSPLSSTWTQLEAATASPAEIDAEDRRFILEDLTPLTRREGIGLTPWYTSGGKTTLILRGEPTILFTHYYRCRHFDEDTRRCTNYENRPPLCRHFPGELGVDWPDRAKKLPPCCSYLVDVDQEPEPVEVTIASQRRA